MTELSYDLHNGEFSDTNNSDVDLSDVESELENEFMFADFCECDLSSEFKAESAGNSNESLLSTSSEWLRVHPPESEKFLNFQVNDSDTGIHNCPARNSQPHEYFDLFFTPIMWNLIVRETNEYAKTQINQKKLSADIKPHSRMQDWVDVTVCEMKKFIGIIINMSLTYKININHYWDTDPTQRIQFYAETMSLRRFQLITSMLSVNSVWGVPKGQSGYDPWHKVRPYLDSMNDVFKRHFIPKQEVCIKESMIGMKNKSTFIQYMPNKTHTRFGIKKFEVCDCQTGYVLHSEVYSNKDFLSDCDDHFTQKIILDLLTKSNLLDKGYHLFTHNWYTKISLAQELIARQTYFTGLVNKTSNVVDKNVLKTPLGPTQTIYFRRNNFLLVGYKEKKSRKVNYYLTTAGNAENNVFMCKSGKEGFKPILIHKYNTFIEGIDNTDKSIYLMCCSRPSKKYWKMIFTGLLDVGLLNSYILYQQNTDRPLEKRDYIVQVVSKLVSESRSKPTFSVSPVCDTLGPAHVLSKLPGKNDRLCVVCAGKGIKKKSTYCCPGCNCGIHQGCYHLLKHFWRPTKPGRRKRPGSDESD